MSSHVTAFGVKVYDKVLRTNSMHVCELSCACACACVCACASMRVCMRACVHVCRLQEDLLEGRVISN